MRIQSFGSFDKRIFLLFIVAATVLAFPQHAVAEHSTRSPRFGNEKIGESFAHNRELSEECARIDCKKDVLRSRNQDLVFNRFGYENPKKRRAHSELSGYRLDDVSGNAAQRLANDSMSEEESDSLGEESAGTRFNRFVQSASSTLLDGFSTVLQQWVGGDPAYAAEEGTVDVSESPEQERDALVHF